MSPPGAWCVDRILFGIHDDHVDAGLRCASIGAVGSLRALCLPTFSHFLNVTKPFLSLSLSLSLSLFPYFFPLDGRSPVSHPTCEVPFPPRRSGEYRKGIIPARQLYSSFPHTWHWVFGNPVSGIGNGLWFVPYLDSVNFCTGTNQVHFRFPESDSRKPS